MHPCPRDRRGARRARIAKTAFFALALLVAAREARANTHPPDLRAEGDCEGWVGTLNGNDTDVRVSARLCPAGGDGVKGQFQTSSLRSGYSVRDLEGRWLDGGARFEGRDTRMVESRPNPGWMFCTVDAYALERRTPDELVGTLTSRACHDLANVVLRRVPKDTAPPPSPTAGPQPTGTATAPSGDGSGPQPSPPPSGTSTTGPPPSPPTATTAGTPSTTAGPPPRDTAPSPRYALEPAPTPDRGCGGCRLGSAGSTGAGAASLLLLASAWLRRRAGRPGARPAA